MKIEDTNKLFQISLVYFIKKDIMNLKLVLILLRIQILQKLDILKNMNKGENMSDERKSKIKYYLDIAKSVSERSTCLKRHYGAVIVKDDEIIATGYNGAPRGRENCCDIGSCLRIKMGIPSGQRYEICRSVHAEMNAIISASRKDMKGSTLYLVGVEPDGSYTKNSEPCLMCKRNIVNAGIKNVIIKCDNSNKMKGIQLHKHDYDDYTDIDVEYFIQHDDSIEEDSYGKN